MRRILVIRSGAIGDCLLTLPVFAALRQAYPRASIEVMGQPSVARLVVSGGYAERVLSIDRGDLASLFVEHAAVPAALADLFGQYDAIVSYLPDEDGVFTANLRRVTAGRVLTGASKPRAGERTHVTHHLLRALTPLGLPDRAGPPSYTPSPDAQPTAAAFFAAHGLAPSAQDVIAVHPGSGGREKCWPAERYASLIEAFADRRLTTVVSCGPADDAAIHALKAHLRRASPVFADSLELPALAAVLARCRVMIGNDSGITHLAAAVGIPTVALFGPTDPAVWGPRGHAVSIFWGETLRIGDAGILQWAEVSGRFPPLSAISVERVLARVYALL